ncbi:hypothetical protein BKA62DRAFT_675706 [Auriculariales sp. MPI-PUGE-AT-0066]|nr:hypothetical protein BKA62DRAFT_675706 [Auriculariales sp. MPI-PUGE-AT-0066]
MSDTLWRRRSIVGPADALHALQLAQAVLEQKRRSEREQTRASSDSSPQHVSRNTNTLEAREGGYTALMRIGTLIVWVLRWGGHRYPPHKCRYNGTQSRWVHAKDLQHAAITIGSARATVAKHQRRCKHNAHEFPQKYLRKSMRLQELASKISPARR